ncbi:hypothetical protein [Nocardia brasiliensis]|uniref:hypothetical protein n=1 Tax=Nocardia brasiliensis TaxID=37326 RepID=UPI00366B31D7
MSNGALAIAIKTLPDFVRSHRTDITARINVGVDGHKDIRITAANAEDAVRMIEQALNCQSDSSAELPEADASAEET